MRLAGDKDDVRAVGLVGMRHVAPVALALTRTEETLWSSITTRLLSTLSGVLLAGHEVEVVAATLLAGH